MKRTTKRAKKVLIMGLGVNGGGSAAARYFAKQGYSVTVTDLRGRTPLRPSLNSLARYRSIRYVLGSHKRSDFENHDLIVRNPAVPSGSPYLAYAVARGIPITNEAAYFLEHARGKIIGITGTRGKSTTASLIFAALRRSNKKVFLTGNIAGTGFFDILDRTTDSTITVAELSSFQLELVSAVRRSPSIAVITNLYRDHINRHGSIASYRASKANIIKYQKQGDIAILFHDQPQVRSFERLTKAQVVFFSEKLSPGISYALSGDYVIQRADAGLTRIAKVPPPSSSIPRINYVAAAVAAHKAGVSYADITKAFQTFKPLRFRLETIAHIKGTKLINDSCATSPDATMNALRMVKKPIILIAGGEDKRLEYGDLARLIKKNVRRVIFLPGSGSIKLEKALRSVSYSSLQKSTTLAKSVSAALKYCGSASTILFSPAAASFNMFLNEFDRGEKFNKLITHALKTKR